MLLEWAPSVGQDDDIASEVGPSQDEGAIENGESNDKLLRLFTASEHAARALPETPERQAAFRKAFAMLSAGSPCMDKAALARAAHAVTDRHWSEQELEALLAEGLRYSNTSSESTSDGGDTGSAIAAQGGLTPEALQSLLQNGCLHPAHRGRHYVAVSLAEAETLRRVLHVRGAAPLVAARGSFDALRGFEAGKSLVSSNSSSSTRSGVLMATGCEVALRYSPVASAGAPPAGDGGVIFDASSGWRSREKSSGGTGATLAEAAAAHNAFRFFDGDMHYAEPGLNALLRGVQRSSTLDRERFFGATVAVRRRLDRKWQDTPIAKVFTVEDEVFALKQRAQAVFVREALTEKAMKKWEAFMAFDSDENGLLGGAEVFGALKWLNLPGLTADDAVDFLEAGDRNRDGALDYKEFVDLLGGEDDDDDDEDDDNTGDDAPPSEGAAAGVLASEKGSATAAAAAAAAAAGRSKAESKAVGKVEPYGVEQVREVLVRRRRQELDRAREDRARREALAADLDRRIFEEELKASASRIGGANPKRIDASVVVEGESGAAVTAGADAAVAAVTAAGSSTLTRDVGTPSGALVKQTTTARMLPTTEWQFTANSAPLRTAVVGKGATFKPVLEDQLKAKARKVPNCCLRGHLLEKLNYTDRYALYNQTTCLIFLDNYWSRMLDSSMFLPGCLPLFFVRTNYLSLPIVFI